MVSVSTKPTLSSKMLSVRTGNFCVGKDCRGENVTLYYTPHDNLNHRIEASSNNLKLVNVSLSIKNGEFEQTKDWKLKKKNYFNQNECFNSY